MGSYQIHIRDLLLRTIIGVNPDERTKRQDVLINVTLHTDFRAAASDSIKDTVNYSSLTKQIAELVESSQFYLIEKMALEIAKVCLQDERVERVTVSVDKPGAVRFTRSVAVTADVGRLDLAL